MKLWKKREHLRKIDLKKTCGRPREDFSRHPHFRKQEYYFFGLRTVLFQNFKDVGKFQWATCLTPNKGFNWREWLPQKGMHRGAVSSVLKEVQKYRITKEQSLAMNL